MGHVLRPSCANDADFCMADAALPLSSPGLLCIAAPAASAVSLSPPLCALVVRVRAGSPCPPPPPLLRRCLCRVYLRSGNNSGRFCCDCLENTGDDTGMKFFLRLQAEFLDLVVVVVSLSLSLSNRNRAAFLINRLLSRIYRYIENSILRSSSVDANETIPGHSGRAFSLSPTFSVSDSPS